MDQTPAALCRSFIAVLLTSQTVAYAVELEASTGIMLDPVPAGHPLHPHISSALVSAISRRLHIEGVDITCSDLDEVLRGLLNEQLRKRCCEVTSHLEKCRALVLHMKIFPRVVVLCWRENDILLCCAAQLVL